MEECRNLPWKFNQSLSVTEAMPYPGRGHINPMMNLCKALLLSSPPKTNIIITFVVTVEWLGFIGSDAKPDNVRFASIPNVIPSELGRARDMVTFYDTLMTKMEAPFERLLLDQLELPPNVILYDVFLYWAVRVGNRSNIPVAAFWAMSVSLFFVFKHFNLLEKNGDFPVNLEEKCDDRVDYIPGIPSTRLADFPHFIDGSNRQILKRMMEAFEWFSRSNYLFSSSISELEPSVADFIKREYSFPVYTTGSAITEKSEYSSGEINCF